MGLVEAQLFLQLGIETTTPNPIDDSGKPFTHGATLVMRS